MTHLSKSDEFASQEDQARIALASLKGDKVTIVNVDEVSIAFLASLSASARSTLVREYRERELGYPTLSKLATIYELCVTSR